jgi:hypothetical protein
MKSTHLEQTTLMLHDNKPRQKIKDLSQNPSLSAWSYRPQTVNQHNFLHHKHKQNYAFHMC